MHKSTLGERIRQARKELGMTQEELAGKDFTKGFISLVELDKAKPSLESLTVLAARLNRPLTFFLEDRLESKRDIDLLNALGEGQLRRGEAGEARLMFREGLRLGRELEDPVREAQSWRNMGLTELEAANYDEALESFENALERYLAADLCEEAAKTYYHIGRVHGRQHKLTQAIEAYRHSLQEAERAEMADEALLLRLYASMASAYCKVGETRDAEAFFERGAETARRVADPQITAASYMDLGLQYREKGDAARAIEYAIRALQLFETRDNMQLIADLYNDLGVMFADRGDWDKALQHYNESLRLRQLIGDAPRQAYTYTELARYHYQCGNLDQASVYCDRSLELLETLGDPLESGRAYLVKGLVEKAKGNWKEATALFEHSAEIFATYNTKAELAETYSELGFLYAEQGDTSRSNEFLAKSVSLFREAGKNGKDRAVEVEQEPSASVPG
jgi:pentatricopeptide repeat protein